MVGSKDGLDSQKMVDLTRLILADNAIQEIDQRLFLYEQLTLLDVIFKPRDHV
jgi:hypothetical protein